MPVKVEVVDQRGTAKHIEGLPGRIDLERPNRKEQKNRLWIGCSVFDSIPRVERGCPRLSRRQGRDPEVKAFISPDDRWDRQIAAFEFLCGFDIIPGDEPPVHV